MTIRSLKAALLLAALSVALGGGARAQEEDTDPHPADRTIAPTPLVDQLNHHRGNGGDDEAPHSLLRPDTADVPGVLGDAPEIRAPLFAAPSTGLAVRSDPWEIPDK